MQRTGMKRKTRERSIEKTETSKRREPGPGTVRGKGSGGSRAWLSEGKLDFMSLGQVVTLKGGGHTTNVNQHNIFGGDFGNTIKYY